MIVDDHKLFNDSLKFMLQDETDMAVVEQVYDGQEALDQLLARSREVGADKDHEKLGSIPIDIVLMDIRMPRGMGGQEATRLIVDQYPCIDVIALTGEEEPMYIAEMLDIGAAGYVRKHEGKAELVKAVRAVYEGSTYYGPEVMKAYNHYVRNRSRRERVRLTARELEIIGLIVEEYTTKEIAAKLFIEPVTVETHRRNLMHKFEVRNTAGLVREAIRGKYVVLEKN